MWDWAISKDVHRGPTSCWIVRLINTSVYGVNTGTGTHAGDKINGAYYMLMSFSIASSEDTWARLLINRWLTATVIKICRCKHCSRKMIPLGPVATISTANDPLQAGASKHLVASVTNKRLQYVCVWIHSHARMLFQFQWIQVIKPCDMKKSNFRLTSALRVIEMSF